MGIQKRQIQVRMSWSASILEEHLINLDRMKKKENLLGEKGDRDICRQKGGLYIVNQPNHLEQKAHREARLGQKRRMEAENHCTVIEATQYRRSGTLEFQRQEFLTPLSHLPLCGIRISNLPEPQEQEDNNFIKLL